MSVLVRVLAAMLIGTMLAGCGQGSPTASPPSADEAAATAAATPAPAEDADGDAFAALFAELDGLEGQARTDRLVELAQEEQGLTVYTSGTDVAGYGEVVSDLYGIDVSVYRAGPEEVIQRLEQEAQAGFAGADLLETNGEELSIANSQGLLHGYEGPALEGLAEASLQDGWTASRLGVHTVSWNTDLVQQPPTSFEDLTADRFNGQLMLESGAVEWYFGLTDFLTTEGGMSADEAEQLFRQMASNAVAVSGNTTLAQFLASGEYSISASVYNHLIDRIIPDGAPVARTPEVEPLVLMPSGVGLVASSQNPASAVLMFEWLLTEGQASMVEAHRVPAREEYQAGKLDGLQLAVIDVDRLVQERVQWQERWDDILRSTQGTAR